YRKSLAHSTKRRENSGDWHAKQSGRLALICNQKKAPAKALSTALRQRINAGQVYLASFCQVSTTVSGFRDIVRIPCSLSHTARSGWSLRSEERRVGKECT